MGKGKKKKREQNRVDRRPCYQEIVRKSEDFENYYKVQNICPEKEWNEMLEHLQSNLPTGFRITSYPKYEAEALLSLVESTLFKDLLNMQTNSTNCITFDKPLALPWYPDRLGWQLQITRNDIRKSEVYFRLHNFLISETQSGNISRQEVVSMIPPLVLDVQSYHKVLDMCAAPGSKTTQLIERLHSTSTTEIPTGVVVANDADNKRCYMLVHQAKRLNSPCTVITNHDASIMPNIFVDKEDGTRSILKFDRVLCDVPCSGDGTMRKNPDIWTKWNAANGNNLHGVQFRILKRGLEMLEIGGRIAYSTCSLNPIENEAVIHRLLVDSCDSVRILDVSSMLPGLKFARGLSHWLPASKDIQCYNKFEDVPEKWRTVVRPTMFPPNSSEIHKFNLHNCLRILPHHQNSGGFFVAVLEKLKPLPWEAESKSSNLDKPAENSTHDQGRNSNLSVKKLPAKRLKLVYKEDPFVFFKENEEVWTSVQEFYEMQTNHILPSCLFTRCEVGKKKNIYLCSPLVRQILSSNRESVKIINSGVRILVRCDKKTMGCAFRLAQEGLTNILSFFGKKRRIEVMREDFVKILIHNDPSDPLTIDSLTPQVREKVEKMTVGSCIIQLVDEKLPICVVGWRGTYSIRAYIAVVDSIHYLRILGEDVSAFDVNKFKKDEKLEDKVENHADINGMQTE